MLAGCSTGIADPVESGRRVLHNILAVSLAFLKSQPHQPPAFRFRSIKTGPPGFFTDGLMSQRLAVGFQIAEDLFTLVLRSPFKTRTLGSLVFMHSAPDSGLAS